MSISLVETVDVPGDLSKLETELKAATVAGSVQQPVPPVKQEQQTQQQSSTDSLPEKLKGKSPAEIADMYRNLESAYGRMANDLGTQRKLTDRLLDLKREEDLANNTRAEPVKVDRSKLLEDPTAELDRFISARESARETESSQRLAKIEGSLAQRDFVQKHPDYATVAADPAFVAWVQASQFRVRAATAAYNGDWGAADELVSEYKDRQKVLTPTPPTPDTGSQPVKADTAGKEALEAARSAGLETSTTAGDNTGKSGKQYRRVDLMELRLKKPDVYYDPTFQDEILRAYSEGRVK